MFAQWSECQEPQAKVIRDAEIMSGVNRKSFLKTAGLCLCVLSAPIALTGCASEIIQHGAIIPEYGLEQIPVGSSREQVLLVLGTPSTTAVLDNEVFYYISERRQMRGPLTPQVIERRVVAVEFDENQTVERVADYGLQDGRVFDFVSQSTPTRGRDVTLIRQLLGAAGQAPTAGQGGGGGL